MKICDKCKRSLPLSEFCKKRSRRDGLHHQCRACSTTNFREYRNKHRERYRAYNRSFLARKRAEALAALGGACKCCGETADAFLTIDHINNDGAEERRKNKNHRAGVWTYYIQVRKQPERYQILCWNCNSAKQFCKTGCPHKLTMHRLVQT